MASVSARVCERDCKLEKDIYIISKIRRRDRKIVREG